MCVGEVVCEPPNNKLDRFSGTLYWRECKCVLTNQNMLLRGCVLRNTEACYGLVIFAGQCVCVCLCVCVFKRANVRAERVYVCVCVCVCVRLSKWVKARASRIERKCMCECV